MTRKWKVKVAKQHPTRGGLKRKLASGVRTALVAAAITAVYFGVIAILMMPAFDVA